MAKSTPIWFAIPEWYGIQQQLDGTLLPVVTAYDARNMETGDGNLSVAKGFTKDIPDAVPGTDHILKLIVAQGSGNTYVVTSNKIYAYVYENNAWGWKAIWTFSSELTKNQVDALQTRIASTDTILVATGETLFYPNASDPNRVSYGVVKIDTSTNTASTFGAGLYSYTGTITAFDQDTGTVTVSPAMDSEAIRRALAYGVIYGDGIYVDVYEADSTHIVLEAAIVSPPAPNDSITVRGGGSTAPVAYTELYSNRLFAAGDQDAPYRLYWSAVPGDGRTIEDWLSVDGSFDASGGYVEVGDGSSDEIIGLTAISNQLIIWKRCSVWRLYGDRPSNYTLERIDKHSDVMSNAGVVTKYDAPYLLMPTGIHMYNNTSVVPVDNGEKPLRRFFDAKPDVSNSRGAFWDNRLYMSCKVGTTQSGYDDAIVVYDIARNSYMIRNGFEIADITSVNSHIYLINGSRYVYEFESGSTYDGQPISAYWLTQPTDFSKKMYRHQAMAMYMHITGSPVKITVYGDYLNHAKSVTPLTARAGYTTARFQTDQQYFIQFKFENISGGAFTLHGGANIYVLSEMKP